MHKKALIIIDMLNDFVDGKLANLQKVLPIIPSTKELLRYARSNSDWVIVFSNDCHIKDDREISLWGEHAMEGSKGAQVINELKPILSDKEWESPKHYYGGFDKTGLAEQLKEKNVNAVYLTGQHTNCCVRHTAYGAYINGFDINIVTDCVASYADNNNDEALEYLQSFYKANLVTTADIIQW